jgi:hypothetical protein
MPTDHTDHPGIALSRIALQLDALVQQALAQDPFDEVGVTLATAMLTSSVAQLEDALYLTDCLTTRAPAELALRPANQAPSERAA